MIFYPEKRPSGPSPGLRSSGLTLAVVLTMFASGRGALAQTQSQSAGEYVVTLTAPTGLEPKKPYSFPLKVVTQSDHRAAGIEIRRVSLSMPAMAGMQMAKPEVVGGTGVGEYAVKVQFPHAGDFRLEIVIPGKDGKPVMAAFPLKVGAAMDMQGMHHDHGSGMAGMAGMEMKGSLGDWSMSREGSGTSWQPESSPMFMKMLPDSGRYELSVMGEVQTGYVDAGGKRGNRQGYANSMAMLMARRETGGGTLGLNFMTSIDAITNGKRGVPNLFQTGETLNGRPLVDRQHPHDLFSEIAASFSKPIGDGNRAFVYFAPVGEPALGNVMFMHRVSGMEVPEAPISHHWFDSAHISFGVATLGLTLKDQWKLEGSAFNGHEPNENRFDIEPIRFNSASGRVSYNPAQNWSFSASFGFLDSPEALEPGLDQHRLTGSASFSQPLANGNNFSTTAIFGQLIVPGKPRSNAFLLEGTLYRGRDSTFARMERMDKDELSGVPAGSYTVNKLLFGHVHNIASQNGFDYGLGGYVGVYSFPSSLNPYYGKSPFTFGIFLRIRPSKM